MADAQERMREELREIEQRIYLNHADDIERVRSSFASLRSVIQQHIDVVAEHKRAFEAVVAEAKRAFENAIAERKRAFEAVASEYKDAIDEATAGWREHAEPVWQAIADDLKRAAPDPNDIEWPKPEADEFKDPLYDSCRSYLDQVDRFRRHQGKTARQNGGAA